MSIIAGAMLQGLGQGIATAGAFGMRWETMMAELDQRRQQRLEELRETAKLSQETHVANARADEALLEERTQKNLSPALREKRKGVLAGQMTGVDDESGGHSATMELTPEEKLQVSRAGMTPAQQAEMDLRQQQIGVSEKQLELQGKSLEATLAHQKEQLKVSWASLDKQMKMAEAQLKRAESAEWASLFKGELDSLGKELAPLVAEKKSLQKTIETLSKDPTVRNTEAGKQQLQDLNAQVMALTEQIVPITTQISTLRLEASSRRNKNDGGFNAMDPLGILGSPNKQSGASKAARS